MRSLLKPGRWSRNRTAWMSAQSGRSRSSAKSASRRRTRVALKNLRIRSVDRHGVLICADLESRAFLQVEFLALAPPGFEPTT